MTASAKRQELAAAVRRLPRAMPCVSPARARALRAGIETALDREGWPWLPGVSRLIDLALIAEAGGAR